MDDGKVVYIGTYENWGQNIPISLTAKDRRHHLYVIGKTGTGKTTLLKNLLIQDIHLGHGVALLDPHGDLADSLLDCIPPWRTDDLVYFNPMDVEHPIGLNLLSKSDDESAHLVASGVVSIFKNLWPDYWGPRLEYLLYVCVASLMECQNTSLLGVPRMLSDPDYRYWVVKQIKDPLLRNFWEFEYEQYGKEFVSQAIAPIQNKIGQLLLSPVVRNILGQVKSKLDMRYMMDNRKIFIANLSKGAIGEDKSNLLGSVLLSKFQLAAMSRANTPEEKRVDFYLYADEFQNFATDAFMGLLSEARKYHFSIIIANQYSAQIRDAIREAVFGNVGSILSFRVGNQDSEALAKEFSDEHLQYAFSELPNFKMIAKVMQNEMDTAARRSTALPPLNLRFQNRANLIRCSREKYSMLRTVIEDKIKRWFN